MKSLPNKSSFDFFRLVGPWINRNHIILVIFLILVYFIIGVLTLRHYGLAWDEGLGNLFFGERYLNYFLSFNEIFLDFKADLPLHHQYLLNLYQSPFRGAPHEFPPVADTLSAATMFLFSYKLGWLNPVDGFHLFTVFFASLFLLVLYLFTAPRFGRFTAWMAVLFMGLFPRFWADMHFNVKDVPQAVFFGLVIFAFWTWYEKPSVWFALAAGVLGGLALGVKANAIFIPLILATGILRLPFSKDQWVKAIRDLIRGFPRRRLPHYFLMGFSALAVYFISWPYLYARPLGNLLSYWRYIFSQGGRTGVAAWNIDPIRQFMTTMPEVMLVALLVGLFVIGKRIRSETLPLNRILLSWLIIPLFRASLPGIVNFDGIRHFLEFLPAAAIIAGLGMDQIARWLQTHRLLQERRLPQFATQALLVILLIASLIPVYRSYGAYSHLYYNSLTGGLAGAQQKWLGGEAADYWAVSYRQGMEWISQNAPSNALVYTMPAGWLVRLSAPVFLRPDIQVSPQDHLPDFAQLEQSEQPVYIMFNLRQGAHQDELRYCQERKQPVYQQSVDGVPILQIFMFGGSEK